MACSREGTVARMQSPHTEFFGNALYDPSLRHRTPFLVASSTKAVLGGASSFCNELLFPNEPRGCHARC